MASWIAMRALTVSLPTQFTVLIIGATSISSTAAITFAKHFGAGKVIGAARGPIDGVDELINPIDSADLSSLDDIKLVLNSIYDALAQ
ncbi:hypothetical protein H2203_005981 [Taxawa tesnikishii (nom. ined.)]|nr:hypothetical protein H2203_005981 [Dothideales sp. JES 119]